MSQDNLQKMLCGKCKNATYYTNKNRKGVERKLAFKKYCKYCRAHTPHVEGKKKGK